MRKIRGWLLQFAVHMKARDLMRNRGMWPDLTRIEIKEAMMLSCEKQFDLAWPEETP